jgi:hypothetical protein
MPQGRRKPTSKDSDRVNDNLEVIAKAINDAKAYIDKHPWDKEKPEDMAKSFDFISKLIDKINTWNDSYMEKSGIMDVYRSVNNVQKKERKGQISGGIESVLKSL